MTKQLREGLKGDTHLSVINQLKFLLIVIAY